MVSALKYSTDVFPELELRTEISKAQRSHKFSEGSEAAIKFVPFGLKLGSGADMVIQKLGSPALMDSKKFRKERCFEMQYRLKVGSLHCRMIILVAKFKVQLILLQIINPAGVTFGDSPVDLLLGHQLEDLEMGSHLFKESGEGHLYLNYNEFRSRFLLLRPDDPLMTRIVGEMRKKVVKSSCERENWYRKAFGTID